MQNKTLPSCPWGPVTANGGFNATNERKARKCIEELKPHPHAKNQAHRSKGCGRRERYGRKEGKLGNILIDFTLPWYGALHKDIEMHIYYSAE